MNDAITRAMEAILRATEVVSPGDWDTQRHLLAAYDQLAEARRSALKMELQPRFERRVKLEVML